MNDSKLNAAFPASIRVGVSACLLGRKVRFDGGHKHCRYLTDILADYFQLISYCPEVAIGMGTPRQPIRLVGSRSNPQAIGVKDEGLNVTQPLRTYGRTVAENIDELCGFVFKKDSPSCGMTRVKLYNENGMPERNATGIFAEEIMNADPLLPVEEEGRLNDAGLRENFIMRVYVYARWKSLCKEGISKSALLEFHASHKYLLMAHSTAMYQTLGRALSDLRADTLDAIAEKYISMLMEGLSKPSTRKQHSNVLYHLLGYLKNSLSRDHREDLAQTIEAYRLGEYPLAVPVKLLRHHFKVSPHPYISRQVYLNPHPDQLGLRNTV